MYEKETLCKITGAMNVFAESCAFSYSVWLSYLVIKKVNNPTSDFKFLHLMAHLITLALSFTALMGIWLSFGFGLSVYFFTQIKAITFIQSTLSCGIALKSERTIGDLIRCWPIIYLPICIFHFIYLQFKVPHLIKSTVNIFHIKFHHKGQELYFVMEYLYAVFCVLHSFEIFSCSCLLLNREKL